MRSVLSAIYSHEFSICMVLQKKAKTFISGGKGDDYFVKIFWLSAGEIKAR